jgi:putative RecB family exonuclease
MSFDPTVVALPRALSPSRLSDFQSCPRKYEYSAVLKLPQPASYASVKGRFVHAILERLFALEPDQRTRAAAGHFIPEAIEVVITPEVRVDLNYNDALEATLLADTATILEQYFIMEDPTTVVLYEHNNEKAVELALKAEVRGAPLYGILDRLDRDANGDLIIVDYKTGSVPRGDYATSAFANAALYVELCKEDLKITPTAVRLLYVAHGETLERRAEEIFPGERAKAAADAWEKIKQAHAAGNFTPRPSASACRFCPADYQARCRAEGVEVVVAPPRRR